MQQINLTEDTVELDNLVRLLETGQEDIICLARNGKTVAQLTLVPKAQMSKRIGVAEGKFSVPDGPDTWDHEVASMFGENI